MHDSNWTIVETTEAEFQPTQLHHKETVFSLSNGYLGTRGTFEEGYPGSCPATLINGVYDQAPVVMTELINCPDWLPLRIQIGSQASDGSVHWEKFHLNEGEILGYKRWLHMRHGVLSRWVRWRSPVGHTLELRFDRFVSLAQQHVMALRCQVTAIDFAGPVEVHASLNGYPDNQGLMHWDQMGEGAEEFRIWLKLCSRHSKIDLGMASRLVVTGSEAVQMDTSSFHGVAAVVARFPLQVGQTVTLEKVSTIYTSREVADPLSQALQTLVAQPDYAALETVHKGAWEACWQASDILIEGDRTAQLAVRYNLFQLLSATPRLDDRVSIPAKALSGFAYRGHVFWDTEIFMLPFLSYTQPALARNLLTYRYHGLPGARRKAAASGYEGAMYAWESADSGDEVTPTWVPHAGNPKELVRIWCGEIELHITTDVAYAVWQYWLATGDDGWMWDYGAEIILDTAVFWGSRVEWNESRDRYEIRDVIGPDEYHERINNNAFTNQMVQWHLQIALKVWHWLHVSNPQRFAELVQRLDLTPKRVLEWIEISRKIWIPTAPDTDLIEQFEGFFDLEDIDLDSYEPRLLSMQVILGIEGANQRQVLKQADVLMLFYLLRQGALVTHTDLDHLEFVEDRALRNFQDARILQTNWNYYAPRTDHTYGSSLSPAIHAVLACELGKPQEAYQHFIRSALVDLADVRGNAAEGVHAASAGGVWQAVVFGFGGVHLTPQGPIANPTLPEGWTRLKFQLNWQGNTYAFDLRSPSEPPARAAERPELAAVIFDLDGVITDTSEFHYQGWKRLADEIGIPFDREQNEALRGVSRKDSLRRLLQGRSVPDDQFQEMMDRKNRYYLELIHTITPADLLPGVADLLADLKAAGIKIALGSSSKNAPEVLERLGIMDYMEAIADGNNVTQSKPAPDVFLYAAEQLGIPAIHCIVVEDAASGIEAAIRAGMWSVGLGPLERVKDAHLVLPNLEGVHWSDLRDRLLQITQPSQPEPSIQHLVQLQKANKARQRV